MQVKNTLIKLVVAAAALFPVAAWAQTSSINAFSPYTMYGIGEQNTPGTLPMRSMGGVGVAMRSTGVVNLLRALWWPYRIPSTKWGRKKSSGLSGSAVGTFSFSGVPWPQQ